MPGASRPSGRIAPSPCDSTDDVCTSEPAPRAGAAAKAEPADSIVAANRIAALQLTMRIGRRMSRCFGGRAQVLAPIRRRMTSVTFTPTTSVPSRRSNGRQYIRPVRWRVHGERVLYDSDWVRLSLADVEIPGGERFEHHVVRMPNNAAGTVVHDRDRGVLLLWRHRFITDTWGWEIPAGGMNPGETPEEAAVRETLEETGWQPGRLRPLVHFSPTNGISDQIFHTFLAAGAPYLCAQTDAAAPQPL